MGAAGRIVLAAAIVAAVLGASPGAAAGSAGSDHVADRASGVIRVATFNASLNRGAAGELARELASPDSPQPRAVAEIIQRVRPDILLLQEFDHDERGAALAAFQSNYLAQPRNGARAIAYPHVFIAESNTGVPSGFDLDNDGAVGGGQDALGFGAFPGQYAMALLSMHPIDTRGARTFRRFLWRDLRGALLPADWYSTEELAVLPLSSKSHWDVPVRVGSSTLHVLASHPTPPTFDGPEDRNGRRNHDEIRFWVDYLSTSGASYLQDDAGRRGPLGRGDFVLLGDLNSDPVDGDSLHGAILALLEHPRVNAEFTPSSEGASQAAAEQGGSNATQRGDPRFDTADFNDRTVGNLRVDYVLPSRGLRVCGGGVFWPRRDEPGSHLVWGNRPPSSDHRLVWLDVIAGEGRCPPGSDPTASGSSRPRR